MPDIYKIDIDDEAIDKPWKVAKDKSEYFNYGIILAIYVIKFRFQWGDLENT